MELLDIVYQNPGVNVADLLRSEDFEYARPEEPGADAPGTPMPMVVPGSALAGAADRQFAEFEI